MKERTGLLEGRTIIFILKVREQRFRSFVQQVLEDLSSSKACILCIIPAVP